jgi:hypothetical protein
MPAASGDKGLPRPQEVFISYSRKDKEFVRRLDEELKRRDREAWVDWEGIPPRDTWEKTIYGAIEATHTFIFVLIPDSIASEVWQGDRACAKRPICVSPFSTLIGASLCQNRARRRNFLSGPRKDRGGFDLMSDVPPFGRLWYAEHDHECNRLCEVLGRNCEGKKHAVRA